MGLIDDTFGPIPATILNDWGETITYIKTATPRTYNPTTGAITGADTNVTLKAVITRINPRESEGLYQTTDLKVIIGTAELGTYFPTEADRIQYTQDVATREANIIAITTHRRTHPVLQPFTSQPP